MQKTIGIICAAALCIFAFGCTKKNDTSKTTDSATQASSPGFKKKDFKTSKGQIMEELGLKEGDKLYATFKTSMGDMVAELYWAKVPNTIANFVGLAKGTREWTEGKTAKKVTKPLYSGTIFHRVIPNFMIQGGDPDGNGRGGPGYTFKDEFNAQLRHDSPGILSMANSGPNTNGSQFFITQVPTPHLNNRHSVFGKIIQNIDLIAKITAVPRNGQDRPNENIVLKEVQISKELPGN